MIERRFLSYVGCNSKITITNDGVTMLKEMDNHVATCSHVVRDSRTGTIESIFGEQASCVHILITQVSVLAGMM